MRRVLDSNGRLALQVVPVFGSQAVNVSPRTGHLHVAVDGAQWVWAGTSGGPIIIAGLLPGSHNAEITLRKRKPSASGSERRRRIRSPGEIRFSGVQAMSASGPKRTSSSVLPLGPINPNIAAEINSSNATTLSSVSAFARVSFRSMTPLSFLIQRESCNGLIHKHACCSYGLHRTRHYRLCTQREGGPRPYTVLRRRERAAPKLIVDPVLPGPLALGVAQIQYRVENVRIVPAFGEAALKLSPRVGHLHITVDDLPWLWAESSDLGTVDMAGMPPGPHKVKIELVDANHNVFPGQVATVTFTVPEEAKISHK